MQALNARGGSAVRERLKEFVQTLYALQPVADQTFPVLQLSGQYPEDRDEERQDVLEAEASHRLFAEAFGSPNGISVELFSNHIAVNMVNFLVELQEKFYRGQVGEDEKFRQPELGTPCGGWLWDENFPEFDLTGEQYLRFVVYGRSFI